jgi:DNA-binding GntR family transcriptional regulator
MNALTKATLADQAYEALHRQIVSGELACGQRLLAEELASVLDISPTPVKEALVRLEAEGLLATELRRGVMVRRFTADDVTELYEARLLIELHALRQGFADGGVTAAFQESLRAVFVQHLAAAQLGTLRGLREALRLDRVFHTAIVGLLRNKVFASWHRRVIDQTHTVRVYTLETYPCPRLQAEHGALLEALGQGDRAAALAALETHLCLSRDEILQRPAFGPEPPVVVVRRAHRRRLREAGPA